MTDNSMASVDLQDGSFLDIIKSHICMAFDTEFDRIGHNSAAKILEIFVKQYYERNLYTFFTNRSIVGIVEFIFLNEDTLYRDFLLNVTTRFTTSMMLVDPGYLGAIIGRITDGYVRVVKFDLSYIYPKEHGDPLEPLVQSLSLEKKRASDLLYSNTWLLVYLLILLYFADTKATFSDKFKP